MRLQNLSTKSLLFERIQLSAYYYLDHTDSIDWITVVRSDPPYDTANYLPEVEVRLYEFAKPVAPSSTMTVRLYAAAASPGDFTWTLNVSYGLKRGLLGLYRREEETLFYRASTTVEE